MKTPVPPIEIMDDQMADILRQKSAAERLRIASRMWRSARVILRGAIQTEHPDWDVARVNREIARRISHGVVHHGLVELLPHELPPPIEAAAHSLQVDPMGAARTKFTDW